jgi:hypothetical protein
MTQSLAKIKNWLYLFTKELASSHYEFLFVISHQTTWSTVSLLFENFKKRMNEYKVYIPIWSIILSCPHVKVQINIMCVTILTRRGDPFTLSAHSATVAHNPKKVYIPIFVNYLQSRLKLDWEVLC